MRPLSDSASLSRNVVSSCCVLGISWKVANRWPPSWWSPHKPTYMWVFICCFINGATILDSDIFIKASEFPDSLEQSENVAESVLPGSPQQGWWWCLWLGSEVSAGVPNTPYLLSLVLSLISVVGNTKSYFPNNPADTYLASPLLPSEPYSHSTRQWGLSPHFTDGKSKVE